MYQISSALLMSLSCQFGCLRSFCMQVCSVTFFVFLVSYDAFRAIMIQAWPFKPGPVFPILQTASKWSARVLCSRCTNVLNAGCAGIAIGLDLPEDFFEGDRAGVDTAYWVARVIHYPPLPKQAASQPCPPSSNGNAAAHEASSAAASSQSGGSDDCIDHPEAGQAAENGLSEISRSVQLSCGRCLPASHMGPLYLLQPFSSASKTFTSSK